MSIEQIWHDLANVPDLIRLAVIWAILGPPLFILSKRWAEKRKDKGK
jgi:hypothetical protein